MTENPDFKGATPEKLAKALLRKRGKKDGDGQTVAPAPIDAEPKEIAQAVFQRPPKKGAKHD